MPFAKSMIALLSVIALCLGFLSPASFAVVDIRDFQTEEQRLRYHNLLKELRCPKCQNQSLAGSDSQVSSDMRREVHALLLKGKSDDEIKDFMVQRYNDYVLYRPRVQDNTLVLWFGPLAIVLMALVTVFFIAFRQKGQTKEAEPLEVDKEQLQQLLGDSDNKVAEVKEQDQ